jgi:AcrR family transcriptional regulator
MSLNRQQLVEAALQLASESSWEDFQLADLAEMLELSLSELSQSVRSRDDIAEAFFDLADQAMLDTAIDNHSSDAERLNQCVLGWFEFVAPHRAQVKEMLAYKLEPGHIHLQAHGITRISRTVQWFLSASRVNRHGLSRITLEVTTTSAYLTSFASLLWDNSDQFETCRQQLKKALTVACALASNPDQRNRG